MKIRAVILALALVGCTSVQSTKTPSPPSVEDVQRKKDQDFILDMAEDHVRKVSEAQLKVCKEIGDDDLRNGCTQAVIEYWKPTVDVLNRLDKDPCTRKVCL